MGAAVVYMSRQMERNLRILKLMRALGYSNIYTPFFIRFLLHGNGFAPYRAFLVVTCVQAGQVAAQLPTGYLSDRFGPKLSLLLGRFLTIAGLYECARASSFGWPILVAAFIAGVGWGWGDGPEFRLATDSCQALGGDWEQRRRQFEEVAQVYMYGGITGGILLGAFISSTVGLRATIWAQVVVYVIDLCLIALLKELPGLKDTHAGSVKHALLAIFGRRSRRLWAIPVFAGSLSALANSIQRPAQVYYDQIKLFGHHLPSGGFGWTWLAIQLLNCSWSITLLKVRKTRRVGQPPRAQRFFALFERRTALAGLIAIGVSCYILMAMTTSPFGLVAVVILNGFGPVWVPGMLARIGRLSGKYEATASSLRRMTQLGLMLGFNALFGWLIKIAGSVPVGLLVVGGVSGICATLGLIAMKSEALSSQ